MLLMKCMYDTRRIFLIQNPWVVFFFCHDTALSHLKQQYRRICDVHDMCALPVVFVLVIALVLVIVTGA